MTSLQYPIGLYEPVDQQTKKQLEAWIDELALIPQKYEEAVVPLTDDQLDTPYRPRWMDCSSAHSPRSGQPSERLLAI